MTKAKKEYSSAKMATLAAKVLDGSKKPTAKEIKALAADVLGNRQGAKKRS